MKHTQTQPQSRVPGMDWPLILLGTATVSLAIWYLLPSNPHPIKPNSDTDNHGTKNDPNPNPNEKSPTSSLAHPLLASNTTLRPYTTSIASYPSIATFYRPHAHASKLPALSSASLPLLVFIHGLGGVLPQFAPLLGSLVNIAPCFAIELPGHGVSGFSRLNYDAYTTSAFARLWKEAIETVCKEKGHERVVLVGHSMGCSIAAMLAAEDEFELKNVEVVGMVALCPKSTPPTKWQSLVFRKLLMLPDWALDSLRWLDRRGGVDSNSVKRFVGDGAGVDLKRLQLSFNDAFKTPVWKRAATGCLPDSYDNEGRPHGGIPGRETWSQIQAPLLLIAGEADSVTKPQETAEIVAYLQHQQHHQKSNQATATQNQNPVPSSDNTSLSTTHQTSHHSHAIKTAILPSPASHALMYDHATYRTVAGLIEDFLSRHISPHLSLGWQLQQLTTTGKWDVKNLEKWRRTTAVSQPIPGNSSRKSSSSSNIAIFRALKTLREQDDQHSPTIFVRDWGSVIGAVIDISHDAPVYEPQALERGGIEYHKFPTVSKVPPSADEVRDFIGLVDRVRAGLLLASSSSPSSSAAAEAAADKGESQTTTTKAIAVHCHYGYNRTGFLIASYLIEKLGFTVEAAIDEFAAAKPPGIRHEHFIDALYLRYCVGLKRAATMEVDDDVED